MHSNRTEVDVCVPCDDVHECVHERREREKEKHCNMIIIEWMYVSYNIAICMHIYSYKIICVEYQVIWVRLTVQIDIMFAIADSITRTLYAVLTSDWQNGVSHVPTITGNGYRNGR